VQVEFITSAVDVGGFPRDPMAEIAFAGRSNVGKSTLINALVGRKVARTSAAPGKTRLANFFRVAREGAPLFRLVDLPGYGCARAVRGQARVRDHHQRVFESGTGNWDRLLWQGGLAKGTAPFLAGVLLLVDSRHPGLPADAHAGRLAAANRHNRVW
jgi:predicted GTPase